MRAWMAVREDETAAELTGVPTTLLKLLAYALGAAFASIAGAFFAAKHQIPALIRRGGGSILFTSSFVGYTNGGLSGMGAYAASKAALATSDSAIPAPTRPSTWSAATVLQSCWSM